MPLTALFVETGLVTLCEAFVDGTMIEGRQAATASCGRRRQLLTISPAGLDKVKTEIQIIALAQNLKKSVTTLARCPT